jgi:hypothetical protein
MPRRADRDAGVRRRARSDIVEMLTRRASTVRQSTLRRPHREQFDRKVTVGYISMLKLAPTLVDDKNPRPFDPDRTRSYPAAAGW